MKKLILLSILFIIGCENTITDNIANIDITSNFLIKINNYYCSIDLETKTMYLPINSNAINSYNGLIDYSAEYYANVKFDNTSISSGDNYDFGNVSINDIVEVELIYNSETINYNLIFTNIPTVMIYTEQDIIPNEPKIYSRIIINDIIGNEVYDSYAGIEKRGGSTSQNSPKNSYDIELWDDEIGSNSRKEELFNLRNDADWHLDAMYLDPSKSRNIVGMNLWSSFGRSEHLQEESDALLSQRGKLVEVFLNNSYLGMYSFNEQIDKKQLGLKSNGGFLYKSEDWTEETRLQGIQNKPDASLDWNGYELKYPNDPDSLHWEPLYNLIYATAYMDDEEFKDTILQLIELDNVIDHFIFINLVQGNDNTGKNMYICRYDDNYSLFFVPWDLDRTFGWYNKSIIGNNLLTRLYELDIDNYKEKVKNRWAQIYTNLNENIKYDFEENINKIILSKAHTRENTKWDQTTDFSDELEKIKIWIDESILFFDNHINSNY